jgi:hypothetical protein
VKTLSVVLIVMVLLVVGLGFYRGWFALSRSAPDAGSNKVNINLATEPDKMKQDAKLVTDKATELTGGVTDDVQADGQAHRQREVKWSLENIKRGYHCNDIEGHALRSTLFLKANWNVRHYLDRILILMLLGAIPTWGHRRNWGYGPSGGLGLVVIVLVVLLLTGRILSAMIGPLNKVNPNE